MEGIRFHLCASALFHACAEGLAVADEFHVPLSFCLAVAMRFQVSRCHIAARLQLRLADGKSLLCKAAGYRAGCELRAREACPPSSPHEPQCRIPVGDKMVSGRRTLSVGGASPKALLARDRHSQVDCPDQ